MAETAPPVRCFVALELAPALRPGLEAVVRRLRASGLDLRWVPPEHWHLTLAFLGDVPAEQVAAHARALQPLACQAAPRLGVRGLGVFPPHGRPRVVWAGLVGDVARVQALAAAVGQALAPHGYRAEPRPFTPHLTLGRVRCARGHGQLEATLRAAGAGLDLAPEPHPRLILFASELRRDGAHHAPLAVIGLGPAG